MAKPEENRPKAQPPPEVKPTAMERIADKAINLAAGTVNAIGDKIKENHQAQPNFMGQVAALGREAAKEAQSTIQEVFFGKPTGMHETGTPLSPTQAMVTSDLGKMPSLDELRAHAKQKAHEALQNMDGQQQSRGMQM